MSAQDNQTIIEAPKAWHFGPYGGRFVPETLIPALDELAEIYQDSINDKAFREEFDHYLRTYVGRPTNLYYAKRLTERLGGAKIYLKREDLCHTGAHKLNNVIGQILIARKMGKPRIVAETGAGQHGVATATVCALFNFKCEVFMGEEDVRRQALNVFRMRLLGAKVTAVTSGTRTLKDATNEAMRDWVTNVNDTHYIIGSVVGPYPYPLMVRDFQSVIGKETRAQMLEIEGRLPDYVLACVGGGSNAIGMFHPFVEDASVKLIGVEAAGHGISSPDTAATLVSGKPGVLHGAYSYLLQDENGQVAETHSVSAGLDYPGVGPEHSFLRDSGRAQYVGATDEEALAGFKTLSRLEGIIPALEPSHAISHCLKLAPTLSKDQILVVNLSGRGDKDVETVSKLMENEL